MHQTCKFGENRPVSHQVQCTMFNKLSGYIDRRKDEQTTRKHLTVVTA